jgi:hypothetical protein
MYITKPSLIHPSTFGNNIKLFFISSISSRHDMIGSLFITLISFMKSHGLSCIESNTLNHS